MTKYGADLLRVPALHKDGHTLSMPTVDRLAQLQQFFVAKGASLGVAKQQALAALEGILTRESLILAFEDCFLIIGVSFLVALPLLLLFKKARVGGPMAAGH